MNKTYASYIDRILTSQLDTYEQICALVKSDVVPNRVDGIPISCHRICGILANHPSLKKYVVHVKGKFNGADHSWLVIKNCIPGVTELIVDVYPWCSVIVSPLLLIKCSVTDAWYVPTKEEIKEKEN